MEEEKSLAFTTEDLAIGYKTSGKEEFLFHDLKLSLYSKELVCLMGPNGIGKSSLIRTITGIQQPLKGSVMFFSGSEESNVPKAQQIAVVLTDKIPAVNFTAYELIVFGRYPFVDWKISLSEKDKQFIEEAIDAVHIRHLAKKKLYELSDGQLQMVMLARALAQDTPVILLDEPTAHLDLNNRVEIMHVLKDLTRTRNKAVLVATHDLDLALQTADKIWLTTLDQKIITGIPEDLVLNGRFDEIFAFKGFDLKTGKVIHNASQSVTVSIDGTGFEFLWTKNALERSGYAVVSESAHFRIKVQSDVEGYRWIINETLKFNSLSDLLDMLKQ
jgi:iron complex transport system ATP-binding protein